MADLILTNSNKSVTIITTEQQQPATPTWFAELTLITHLWNQSGLVAALNKRVKVSKRENGII